MERMFAFARIPSKAAGGCASREIVTKINLSRRQQRGTGYLYRCAYQAQRNQLGKFALDFFNRMPARRLES
jgi:hypothetical protein